MTSPVMQSPLGDDDRGIVGAVLNEALADLVDLSLVGKQAHWNVVGRGFRNLHLHLDEVVDAARSFADEVAERAVTVGVPPDGRAQTVARTSALPPHPGGWVQDVDVVGYVVEVLGAVIARLRGHVAAVADLDVVSQDLLVGITAALEKQHWMFQAGR